MGEHSVLGASTRGNINNTTAFGARRDRIAGHYRIGSGYQPSRRDFRIVITNRDLPPLITVKNARGLDDVNDYFKPPPLPEDKENSTYADPETERIETASPSPSKPATPKRGKGSSQRKTRIVRSSTEEPAQPSPRMPPPRSASKAPATPSAKPLKSVLRKPAQPESQFEFEDDKAAPDAGASPSTRKSPRARGSLGGFATRSKIARTPPRGGASSSAAPSAEDAPEPEEEEAAPKAPSPPVPALAKGKRGSAHKRAETAGPDDVPEGTQKKGGKASGRKSVTLPPAPDAEEAEASPTPKKGGRKGRGSEAAAARASPRRSSARATEEATPAESRKKGGRRSSSRRSGAGEGEDNLTMEDRIEAELGVANRRKTKPAPATPAQSSTPATNRRKGRVSSPMLSPVPTAETPSRSPRRSKASAGQSSPSVGGASELEDNIGSDWQDPGWDDGAPAEAEEEDLAPARVSPRGAKRKVSTGGDEEEPRPTKKLKSSMKGKKPAEEGASPRGNKRKRPSVNFKSEEDSEAPDTPSFKKQRRSEGGADLDQSMMAPTPNTKLRARQERAKIIKPERASDGERRSTRNRTKPIEFWRGERAVYTTDYAGGGGETTPKPRRTLVGVVVKTPQSEKADRKRAQRKKKNFEEEEAPTFSYVDDKGKVHEIEVVKKLSFKEQRDSGMDIKVAKYSGHKDSGQMEVTELQNELSKKGDMIFQVTNGTLLLTLRGADGEKVQYRLTKGDNYVEIPQGVAYSMERVGKAKCSVSWHRVAKKEGK